VDKTFSHDELNSLKPVFNGLRNHYMEQVRNEIKNFVEKYNLKEKLELKSEMLIYNNLMQELGISLEELRQLEEINNLSDDSNNANNLNNFNDPSGNSNNPQNSSNSVLKYYISKYAHNKNKELELENEKLREELRKLKEKNNLNLNNMK